MTKKESWGEKFIDNRDWAKTDKRLVKMGEYMLDLEFVDKWDKELAEMNLGKVGAPFKFPNSMIQLQAIWHAKGNPYRMIEGITIQLVEMSKLPDFNDHSTIDRRVNCMPTKIDPPQGKNLVIFSDGTSLQVVEGGEYLREKYGKKNRRWVQVVIWGDTVTKEPVSFEVNIIQSSEIASAKKQIEELLKKGVDIKAAGGDGAFDEIEFWNWLDWKGIYSLIKPDKNASEDTESVLRNLAVRWRNENGYNKWREKTGYGERWPATEGIFSAVKRMFGEQIHAKSEIGILQEAAVKFWAYKKLCQYGKA